MEDVDGELFSGFPVGRDSHDQSEDGAMSPLVKRMQRELVARGHRLDEHRPVLLRHRSLGLGIQHVAQCCRHLCVRPLAMLEAQAGTISCCSRGSKFRCCRSRSEEHTSELQSLMRISYADFC